MTRNELQTAVQVFSQVLPRLPVAIDPSEYEWEHFAVFAVGVGDQKVDAIVGAARQMAQKITDDHAQVYGVLPVLPAFASQMAVLEGASVSARAVCDYNAPMEGAVLRFDVLVGKALKGDRDGE